MKLNKSIFNRFFLHSHTLRNVKDWTIQLGITRRHSHSYYGRKVSVKAAIPHPLYDAYVAHDNDIALFQVKFNRKLPMFSLCPTITMQTSTTIALQQLTNSSILLIILILCTCLPIFIFYLFSWLHVLHSMNICFQFVYRLRE